MFLNAINCPEVKSKAMMNLALVYIKKGENTAAKGNLQLAQDLVVQATDYLDHAKMMLDDAISNGMATDEVNKYASQFRPLRLQCHRIIGSILFGLNEFDACENEFRRATIAFPEVQGPWEMLARVLELQGKTDQVADVREQIQRLFQH